MRMFVIGLAMTASLAAAVEKPPIVIEAGDTPVKLSRATVVTVEGAPPVLLYAAISQVDYDIEQFTVMVYTFDGKGFLKTEQIAPGRRTLEAKSTKYSTMVLDGGTVEPADTIVIGVNQAQRANSESWWRTDLRKAAEAAGPQKNPK